MVRRIDALFLLAGHGLDGSNASDGATGAGTTERREASDVVRELVARLQLDPQLKGIPLFTIGLDERLNLAAKTKRVNDICRSRGFTVSNSLLLECHLNSGSNPQAHGLEVWYYAGDATAEAFALTLAEELKLATGLAYHGSPVKGDTSNRYGRLGILRDTIPLAALLELGYLSNPGDAAMHTDSVKDDTFSLGALNGIRRWIGYATTGETAAASAPVTPPPAQTIPTPEGSPDGAAAAGYQPTPEMVEAFGYLLGYDVLNDQSPRDELNYRIATLLMRCRSRKFFTSDAP